jgi:hypothetical protein
MPFTPIFALWFSNPLLLWGLGAASLPVIIHLLNRRKYREMPWAAMRFLVAALKKNQRRVKIEQWLLLAVRTLLVLALVLAMARPFLESLGAVALLPGQRTHWVLALDGSMSMEQLVDQTRRFDTAKTLATQLVKTARPGDGISLVLLAEPPRALIGAPAFQKEAVLTELNALNPTHGGLDLPASFRKVEEVLAASDIPRKELVVLTDLQTASWNRPGATADDTQKRLFARLAARRVRSTVIDLGKTGAENHAVTDLRLDPPIVTPDIPVTVRATLRQFGKSATSELRARLVVDGKLGPEEVVTLEPGQDQAVAFPYQFPAPGEHVVEVLLDPDALKVDDRRRPEALKSETAFLGEALDPEPQEAAGNPAPGPRLTPIQLEVVGESQLAGRELAPYDAIILANIARLTPAEAAALDAYLEQGGGLVIFGGDRVVPDSYNASLFRDGKGLLPAAIGPTVGDATTRERPFELDPKGFRHPLVSSYAGEAPGVVASLTGVKTTRYHRLRVPPASAAQVALAFSSGDPAVVEAARGRGRVYLVATSADADWTTWPLHQSYPPIMEQLTLLAASGRASERNVRAGQPLVEAFPAGATGASFTIQRPGGPPVTGRLEAAADISVLRYDGTELSGVYPTRIDAPLDREIDFAVNPDPAESDPAKLDAASLKAALPGWEFVNVDDWNPLRDDAGAVARRGEFHRPLLWAVLGLLLAESFLAWRFGHQTPRNL